MKNKSEQTYLLLDKMDNTLTALMDLSEGDKVSISEDEITITIMESIPYAHKFARRAVAGGEKIIKYGAVIGIATENILEGAHVHIHNVKGLRA